MQEPSEDTVCHAFLETVTDQVGDYVLASTIRPATQDEILEARKLHEQGKCPHHIVTDEKGWMYDYRSCFTCGKGLGAI